MSALLTLPPITKWKEHLNTFNDDQLSVIQTVFSNKNYKLVYRSNLNQVINIVIALPSLFYFKYIYFIF